MNFIMNTTDDVPAEDFSLNYEEIKSARIVPRPVVVWTPARPASG